jgi:hypothetical protein
MIIKKLESGFRGEEEKGYSTKDGKSYGDFNNLL